MGEQAPGFWDGERDHPELGGRRLVWQDAARHLEQALTAIPPALPDTDAIRCDVLVELGQARPSAGEASRRLGRPEELAIAVSAYLWSALVTGQLPQLHAVPDEMLRARRPDLTPQGQAILVCYQLMERIRIGELGRFDTEFAQAWRLADDVLHSPELQGHAAIWSAATSSAGPASLSLVISPCRAWAPDGTG